MFSILDWNKLAIESNAGSLFKYKRNSSLLNDISPRESLLQASSSPVPQIRIWSIAGMDTPKYGETLRDT